MKMHDFGLWFYLHVGYENWYSTIPQTAGFYIFYDGKRLGTHYHDYSLSIFKFEPHIIKLKKPFISDDGLFYDIGHIITLDDFEIVENPRYKGA
jgi:hypothetical protein